MRDSEVVKLLREKTQLNKKDFAALLGVSPSAISNVETGERELSKSLQLKLVEKFSLNPGWLLTGEGDMFALPQRLDEKLVPCLEGIWDCPEDRLVPLPGSSGLELQALRVTGDSMQPTLKEGDVAICQPSGWLGDGLYILRNMEFFSVKRVVLAPDGYRIVSDNAIYPAYNCPAESLGLVGKVAFALVRM